MAESNETADSGKTVAPESKIELPNVESPPLSPESLREPVLEAQLPAAPIPHPQPQPIPQSSAAPPKPRVAMPKVKIPPLKIPQVRMPEVKLPSAKFSRRLRYRAALAATVMLAAGFGAAVGAIANRAPPAAPPQRDTALIEENHALQRSVARLTKDLGALKANVETASRDARESRTQVARVTEKVNDKLNERTAEVTGSIGKPATVAATPSPPTVEKPAAAPMPTPRPAIVQGWTVREARNGRVFVESRGEYFQVAPGVPLPGLGRVEAIRREGDNLVVVTQKGLITSAESSAAIRPRQAYPPYYRPY